MRLNTRQLFALDQAARSGVGFLDADKRTFGALHRRGLVRYTAEERYVATLSGRSVLAAHRERAQAGA
jgi:hypothetical protein